MPYRTVFFDLDGTLTDPAEGILNAVRYALREMKRPLPPEELMTEFIGPPLFDGFCRLAGLSEEEALAAVNIFRVYFSETGIFENRLFDGVPALLSALRACGVRIALATSKPEVFARRILDHFGLAPYFNSVTGIPLGDERSEKREVILRAMEKEKICDPKTAVMVGDRRYDIAAARACGIPAIGVLFGFGSREELLHAGAAALAADIPALAALLGVSLP